MRFQDAVYTLLGRPFLNQRKSVRCVYAVLTARCNLACAYCYQNKKNARRMDGETLSAAVALVLDSVEEGVELVFYGGEPLLEFSLIRRAVAEVEKRRPSIRQIPFRVVTNGILLDEEKIGFLASRRILLQLSFDGVRRTQDLRGKGTFSALERLLDHLRANHAPWFEGSLGVSITLCSAAVPYLADSIEYLCTKGIRGISIGPVFNHDPGWAIGQIDDLDRQFERISSFSAEHFRKTGEVPVLELRRSVSDSKHLPSDSAMCNAARGKAIAVDVDGRAYSCVAFARSFQKYPETSLASRWGCTCLGDIRDPAFPERLAAYPEQARATGMFTDKEKKYSSYGRCGDCPYLSTCGVCPASIAHVPWNTDIHRVSDLQCAYYRVSQKYRERFPAQASAADIRTKASEILNLAKRVREAVTSHRESR